MSLLISARQGRMAVEWIHTGQCTMRAHTHVWPPQHTYLLTAPHTVTMPPQRYPNTPHIPLQTALPVWRGL